jgi:hypothetical protein
MFMTIRNFTHLHICTALKTSHRCNTPYVFWEVPSGYVHVWAAAQPQTLTFLLSPVRCAMHLTIFASSLIFRRLSKTAENDYSLRHVYQYVCLSARLSVRMEQLASHRTDFHEIWYLSIFRKFVKKCPLHFNLTRITGTLHEDLCTFMIISRWFLLRIRNVSDKSCRENQNTHFISNNFFPKIVPFMR